MLAGGRDQYRSCAARLDHACSMVDGRNLQHSGGGGKGLHRHWRRQRQGTLTAITTPDIALTVLKVSSSQGSPQVLAWPETFGRTDSNRCRRSREMNDFQTPLAQTPRTFLRHHYGISELRLHRSSFDADLRLEVEDQARLEDGIFGTFPKTRANTR